MVKDHSNSERKPVAATSSATLSDWRGGGGLNYFLPISTEGSGTPTTRPETGTPV